MIVPPTQALTYPLAGSTTIKAVCNICLFRQTGRSVLVFSLPRNARRRELKLMRSCLQFTWVIFHYHRRSESYSLGFRFFGGFCRLHRLRSLRFCYRWFGFNYRHFRWWQTVTRCSEFGDLWFGWLLLLSFRSYAKAGKRCKDQDVFFHKNFQLGCRYFLNP